MGRSLFLPAVAVVTIGLAGCGSSARYVAKDIDGGIVAIPSDTDVWPTHNRKHAEDAIRRHVGPDYEIVSEGEVVTGQVTNHDQQVRRDKADTPVKGLTVEKEGVSATSTTRDITEYHITYRRRAAAAAGTPPVPATAGRTPAGGGVQPASGFMPQVGPRP